MQSLIGSLVLYRQQGSSLPLWPGMVCPLDVAPQEFLDTKPRTHVHLVLLIGQKLVFRWALTSEMHDYDPSIPFTDDKSVRNTPGLSEAFAMSNIAIEDGLGLEHWKWRVRNEVKALSPESETFHTRSSPGSGEDFVDSEMQLAIQESRLDFEKATQRTFSTGSLALPRYQEREKKIVITVDSEDDDDDLHFLRSNTVDGASLTKETHRSFSSKKRQYSSSHASQSSDVPAVPGSSHAVAFAPRTFADGINFKRLSEKSNAPKSDVIEGDVEASKTYVRVRVGPQRDERVLLKADVWDRAYFRESNAGIMYFSMDEDGMFELKHPGLADIDPDDFTFVAEYLESGKFGHVTPEGADQENEAFSQIVAAWTVAEILGMTDMMDHMIDKLAQLAPWDLWHVMLFACSVYRPSGISLPAQVKIKEMLAGSIAENFWIFIEDDHLSADFVQRLKDLPELDRDVSIERTRLLDGRLQRDMDGANGPG